MNVDPLLAEKIRIQNSPNHGEFRNYASYSIWHISEKNLKTYGKGIFVYFSTLSTLKKLFFLLSLLVLPQVLLYYCSSLVSVNWHRLDTLSLKSVFDQPLEKPLLYLTPFTRLGLKNNSELLKADRPWFVLSRRNAGLLYTCLSLVRIGVFYVFVRVMSRKIHLFDYTYQWKTVKVSDYTVFVSDLPQSLRSPEELQTFFASHWGEVAELSVVYNDYEARRLRTKLTQLEGALQRESTLMSNTPTGVDKANLRKMAQEVGRVSRQLRVLAARPVLAVAAFVTFEQQTSLLDCLYDVRRGLAPLFRDRFALSIQKAKEPSNTIFKNLAYSPLEKLLFRAACNAAIVALGLVCMAGIFLLFRHNHKTTAELQKCYSTSLPDRIELVAADDTSLLMCYCVSNPFELLKQPRCAPYKDVYYRYSLSSFLFSLVLGLLKYFAYVLIRWLVRKERHTSYSVYQAKQFSKTLAFYFFASNVAVLLVNTDFSALTGLPLPRLGEFTDLSALWFKVLGSAINYAMMAFLVSPHFLALLVSYPWVLLYRHLAVFFVHSQKQLNRVYCANKFHLSKQYASVGQLVLFVCFFADVAPVFVWLAALSLLCFAFAETFYFARVYINPPKYDLTVAKSFQTMLKVSVFMQLLVAAWVYGHPVFNPVRLPGPLLGRLGNLNSAVCLLLFVLLAIREVIHYRNTRARKKNAVMALVNHPSFSEAKLNRNNNLDSYNEFVQKMAERPVFALARQRPKTATDASFPSFYNSN